MRFRPISVWQSATLGVAECHNINIQSACLRHGKSFILLPISDALVSPGNEVCKRYANLIDRLTSQTAFQRFCGEKLPMLALFSSRAEAPKKIMKPFVRLAVPLTANYLPLI
jgi:hypothetical protein